MALIPYQLPLGAENQGSGPPVVNPNSGWPFPVQAGAPRLPPNETGWAPTSGPGYPTAPISNPVPEGARQAGGTPAMFASQGGGPLQPGGGVPSAVGRFGQARANVPGAPPAGPPSYAEQAQLAVGAPPAPAAPAAPDDQELARRRALMALAMQSGGGLGGLGSQLSSLFNQPQAAPAPVAPQQPSLPGMQIPLARRLS